MLQTFERVRWGEFTGAHGFENFLQFAFVHLRCKNGLRLFSIRVLQALFDRVCCTAHSFINFWTWCQLRWCRTTVPSLPSVGAVAGCRHRRAIRPRDRLLSELATLPALPRSRR